MKTNIDLDKKTLTVDGVEYEIKKKEVERYPIGAVVINKANDIAIVVNSSTCPHSGEHSYCVIYFDEYEEGDILDLNILKDDDYGCTHPHRLHDFFTRITLAAKSI